MRAQVSKSLSQSLPNHCLSRCQLFSESMVRRCGFDAPLMNVSRVCVAGPHGGGQSDLIEGQSGHLVLIGVQIGVLDRRPLVSV